MNLSVVENQGREMLQQAEDCSEENPDTCIMIGNLSTFTRILAQLCEQRYLFISLYKFCSSLNSKTFNSNF